MKNLLDPAGYQFFVPSCGRGRTGRIAAADGETHAALLALVTGGLATGANG